MHGPYYFYYSMLVFSHNTRFIEAIHYIQTNVAEHILSATSLGGKSLTMLSLYLLLRHEDRMDGCVLIIRKWRVVDDGHAKSLVNSPVANVVR